MFGYYFDLALRSFKRNKVLTAVMVVLIGVGVAATMTTFAVLRAVSGDPVPGKSAHNFTFVSLLSRCFTSPTVV